MNEQGDGSTEKHPAHRRLLWSIAELLDDAAWQAGLFDDPTRGVPGLLLEPRLGSGHVEIYSCVLRDGVKSYPALPHGSIPHYEVVGYDAHGGAEQATTPDLDEALRLIEAWRTRGTPPPALEARSFSSDERAHLTAFARRLRSDGLPSVRIEVDAESPELALTCAGRTALREALSALAPGRLAVYAPRGDDGRLALKTSVLLTRLESEKHWGKGRALWLVARTPARRRDGHCVRLVIDDCIAENATHRWDHTPHLWRASPEPQPREDIVALLDEGRFSEALDRCGLSLGDRLLRVLEGTPLNLHDAEHARRWREVARRILWESAPERLRQLFVAERERLAEWTASKRGRDTKPVELRLALLPHQRHQVKAAITLWADAGESPRLDIIWSGGNRRLAASEWQRDIFYDLVRFGEAPHPDELAAPEVQTLEPAPSPEAQTPLADLLRGRERGDFVLRARKQEGCRDLRELVKKRPPAAAARELLDIAQWGAEDDRRNAIALLELVASAEEARELLPLLSDPSSPYRSAVLSLVEKATPPEAFEVIVEILRGDEDQYLRIGAARAVRAYGGGNGARALAALMDSPDPTAREAACLALCILPGAKTSKRRLRELREDAHPPVAEAAALAMKVNRIR